MYLKLLDQHGNWDSARVHIIFLPIDSDFILKIKASRRGEDDALAWQLEKSGLFTVRSVYRLALQSTPEQCNFPASSVLPDGADLCWAKIWGPSVPPKVKVFAWKAASNGLATESNKVHRGMRGVRELLVCVIFVAGRKRILGTPYTHACMQGDYGP